jgi:hypothetical protein
MVATLNFPTPATNAWDAVHIGGGGYVTGLDVAADGTMVNRVDVYGCHGCIGTGVWSQLVTTINMPSSLVGVDGSTMKNAGTLGGYEVRIAATNNSVFYMFVGGAVLVTFDRGTNWTNMTNWASMGVDYQGDANGQASRLFQKKMAIDPLNANIVFIGTPVNGLYKTLNGLSGASATFSAVTGVPNTGGSARYDAPGVRGVVFDPSHFSGSVTQYIYAATDAGVYASTNAGVSWTLLSGSPTNVLDATVSQGVLYVATDYKVSGGVYKYTGGLSGTWTKIYSHASGVACLAVNPFNPNWMAIMTNGGAYLDQTDSLTTTNTWFGPYYYEGGDKNVPPSDVGWLSETKPKDAGTGLFTSSNNWVAVSILFDPIVANRVWIAWGYGVSYYDLPNATFSGSTQMAWANHVAGMELMVARTVVSLPGYAPIISFMDEQVFRITDPAVYPPGSGTTIPAYGLGNRARNSSAWGMDGSLSAPGVIGVLSTGFYVGLTGGEFSSYSTNGGASWTLFPAQPTACDFTGSISGTTLTVTAVTSGTLCQGHNFQSGPATAYYISGPQLTGTPGGVGTYPVPAGTPAASSGPMRCVIDGGQITCTDATHFVAVAASLTAKPVYTTNAGATWLPCNGLPADMYVSNGGKYNGTQMLTNDAAGNMYCYLGSFGSPNIGTYFSTNGGANWTRVSTTNLTATSFFLCMIKAVPGIVGKLFFALGSGPPLTDFYTTTYSGTGTLTWTVVPNVREVFSFGFGAAAGGGFTAPTLWLMGWVNKGATGYKFGVWKSRDLGVSDWTWYTDYPAGIGDAPTFIGGDANDPTKCYVGYTGTSAVYGQGLN